ncbi:MAG: ComEC/Rec2 family competence protein [Treponema sp.]|nr:ComEC/Rec2 family competence protein [Treponema sp.]
MVSEFTRKPFVIAAFICAVLFYCGMVKIPQRFPFITLFDNKDITELCGVIESSPVKTSSGMYYYAKTRAKNVFTQNGSHAVATGTLTVMIPSSMVEVFFPGKLYSTGSAKGAFLYEQGCNFCFNGYFSGESFIVKSCRYSNWQKNLPGNLWYIRALCRLHLKRLLYLWKDAGGLLLALLCGAREYTDSSTAEAFKNAGLSHILALSGMHLSLFSGIALFVGNKIGNIKISFVLRIVFILLFVWFAGFSASLCRAFICALLLLLSSVSGVKRPDMLVILCVSFLLQSVLFPGDIKNAGFILSYAALGGILVTQRVFSKIYLRFCPPVLSNSIASSTGAQLFTAPVSLAMFGSCNPFGIIASVFLSPLVTIFIYAGLALIILSLIFPPLAKTSGIFMNILYTIIRFLVLLFAKVPSIKIN